MSGSHSPSRRRARLVAAALSACLVLPAAASADQVDKTLSSTCSLYAAGASSPTLSGIEVSSRFQLYVPWLLDFNTTELSGFRVTTTLTPAAKATLASVVGPVEGQLSTGAKSSAAPGGGPVNGQTFQLPASAWSTLGADGDTALVAPPAKTSRFTVNATGGWTLDFKTLPVVVKLRAVGSPADAPATNELRCGGGDLLTTVESNNVIVETWPVTFAVSPSVVSVTGGETLTVHGYNLASTDGVTFGDEQTFAPKTRVIDEDTIQVVAPPHAAAEGVRVNPRWGGGGGAKIDFIAPPAPGELAVNVPSRCTLDGTSGVTFKLTTLVRAKIPTSVANGKPVALSAVRLSHTIDADNASLTTVGTGMSAWTQQFTLGLAGASAPSLPLLGAPTEYPGYLTLKPGGSSSWDTPTSGTLPDPATVTSTGGPLTLRAGELRVKVRIADKDDPYIDPIEAIATCQPAVGAPALAVIPSSSTALAPVVTRVSGSGFAGVGGVATISGQRLTGVTSVKIGTKTALFVVTGGVITVFAPAQPAGTYTVTVTTRSGGVSAPSAARFIYRRLL